MSGDPFRITDSGVSVAIIGGRPELIVNPDGMRAAADRLEASGDVAAAERIREFVAAWANR